MKKIYNTFVLPKSRYKLVDLNDIFVNSNIEHVKNIFENQLTNKSIIRKYFYHTYIFNICKSVIDNNKKHVPVLIFNTEDESLSNDESKIFDKFLRMFPVINIKTKISFNYFIKSLSDAGMREEISNVIYCSQDKISRKRFYFSKIENFCKRYELTFLDKKFFGDIKNKMLMI